MRCWKMIIFYIYKIHFLCGFPSGRYYIGKHKHPNDLKTDTYTGSGNFCKAYFKKYGKQEGITYIKEILEINQNQGSTIFMISHNEREFQNVSLNNLIIS